MSSTTQESSSTDELPRGWIAFKDHVVRHKIQSALLVTRFLTILFTLAYLIPIFGPVQSYYQKVLLANGATSALRLHQRVPQLHISREFLVQLFMEDSCHYLFYSLIFLYSHPITFVLVPVVLFAILHSASYSLALLDTLGQSSWWGCRFIISVVEYQSRNILQTVAFTEILIMPLTVLMVFTGQASIFIPFVYYRFLTFRYASRRNPYTRHMFHELRLMAESLAAHPRCPTAVANVTRKGVSFISNLCPPMPAN